jgi:F1F0 ATPase subunit 2
MDALNTLLFGGLGLLLGLWHFASLRWISQRLVDEAGPHWRQLAAVHLLRIVVLVAACWWAVDHGAWALIALTVGMLVARVLLVKWSRPTERTAP